MQVPVRSLKETRDLPLCMRGGTAGTAGSRGGPRGLVIKRLWWKPKPWEWYLRRQAKNGLFLRGRQEDPSDGGGRQESENKRVGRHLPSHLHTPGPASPGQRRSAPEWNFLERVILVIDVEMKMGCAK